MEKITLRVFISSSVAFGILGILLVLIPTPDFTDNGINLYTIIQKLFMVSVFVILTSFALTIAGKYLKK